MRRVLAVILGLIALSGCARSAGNFGFGPPPTLEETREAVNQYLTAYLHTPDSAQDLRIEKPRSGCFYRGPGKRDICGYQVCFSYSALNQRGGYVKEKQALWITKGFGHRVQPATTCPSVLQDWDGNEPVMLGDFCEAQPAHRDCLKGRQENYLASAAESESLSTESHSNETAQEAFAAKQAQRWQPASEEDIKSLHAGAERFLKDGASARYLDVKVGPSPDVPGVRQFCGLVNAKNSWGAYGGYTRFFYVEAGFFVMEEKYNGQYLTQKCK